MAAIERCALISRATGLIRERAPDIARALTLEQGKPLAESLREGHLAADIIDFLAEESRRLASRGIPPRQRLDSQSVVHRVPVGPVAAFTPGIFQPICRHARSAVRSRRDAGGHQAGGRDARSCLELARAFVDAGLPPGVLNVVCGDPAEIFRR